MSIKRIYVRPEQIKESIQINDKNIIHKLRKVLRFKNNEEICVVNGEGKEYLYAVETISKKLINLKQKATLRNEDILTNRIILAFPLTKEERIDFILQKTTELGVRSFIPFVCERSLHFKPSGKRKERWNKIIVGALEQSTRLWLPLLEGISDFNELLKINAGIKLAGSINGEKAKSSFLKSKDSILIVVGPEGDFTRLEFQKLKENNFKFINLSSNLLRVETACMFFVGVISYLSGSKE